MFQRWARGLQLRPQELGSALLLGSVLFTITSSYTLIKTARDSLFLSELPASDLPYVYLGVGILALAFSQIFAVLTQRLPAWITLAGTALVAALTLMLFSNGFTGFVMRWVPPAFYLWVNVYGLIVVSQFWAFTTGVSDPREAKRIFGIIGGCGIFGGLVAGLVAGWIGRSGGVAALTQTGAILLALAAPVTWAAERRGALARVTPAGGKPETASAPWKQPYVRWLALAVLCSVVVTGLLDYLLKFQIQRRDASVIGLASFFGTFYTVQNLAALALQLFLTRRLLEGWGAAPAAAMLPLGLGAGAAATMIAPGFATVLATRLWDQVVRLSLNRSAIELFYFPLEPALRRRTKAFIDAGIERAGDGLAGLVILAGGLALRRNTPGLALIVLLLVCVWLFAWVRVRRGYSLELGRNLHRLNLTGEAEPVSLREAGAIQEMVRLLESPDESAVLRGVELLDENAPWRLDSALPRVLRHPVPAVRVRALELAALRRPAGIAEHVEALLEDPDPVVRLHAFQTYSALGHERPAAAWRKFLGADDPRVRETALRGLVEFAPDQDEPAVREVIERLLRGGPVERRAAAEALGLRPAPSALHELISPLHADPDLEVRRAALVSAGRAGRRDDVPVLVRALGVRDTGVAARAGLLAMGESVVGTLGDYLCDPATPMEARRQIPALLAEVPVQASMDALLRCRDRSDVVLLSLILKAAHRIRVANEALVVPRELVQEDITHDVDSYLRAMLWRLACPKDPATEGERFLLRVLEERIDQALGRIFLRLALIRPPRTIKAAFAGLRSSIPAARAHSLEYLESTLAPELEDLVMPLVDDPDGKRRLELAKSRLGLEPGGHRQALESMLDAEDGWLKACALYVIGVLRERALLDKVTRNLDARDERVRESARWAEAALGSG